MEGKIKLGLLIEGNGLENVDMQNPSLGNPGIGGTQYCFLLLAYYLNLFYPEKFSVSVISYVPLSLPEDIINETVTDLSGINGLGFDIIVLKTPQIKETYKLISDLSPIKFITWSHNFLYSDTADMVSSTANIVANVFVGKQMYDFYIDDDVIDKSTYIYNVVPDPLDENKNIRKIPDNPVITFMGSLSKSKGFITLLKIWSKVCKRYPDATLNIIGGGNLYNRNFELGPLGIADKDTEAIIRPYITTEDGQLDKRIKFHGILGKEKYDIFLNSTVGIVNPSAKTETFGMGIIEMACASLPVVTKNWNGHPDTALDKRTALLAYSIDGMRKAISKLIEDKSLNYKYGNEAKIMASRFSPQSILPEWVELIEKSYGNNPNFKFQCISTPYWNNYKVFRLFNRLLRYGCHLKFIPSIVEYETFVYRIYKKLTSIVNR